MDGSCIFSGSVTNITLESDLTETQEIPEFLTGISDDPASNNKA